jgi:hypothetical protein
VRHKSRNCKYALYRILNSRASTKRNYGKYGKGNSVGKRAITLCVLLSGCSSSVNRIGYSKPSKYIESCEIPIIREYDEKIERYGKSMGRLQLGESGVSISCSESSVLKQFITEGCSLGADLIVINNEQKPDFSSSCFRAEAEFMKMDSTKWKSGKWKI